MSTEKLFDNVLIVSGHEYLQVEQQLIESGNAAKLVLTSKLNEEDAFSRIYAKTMLNWIEGRSPNNDIALQHLATLPEKLSHTPIPNPSPLGTASYIKLHYSSSVTDILGIRIIKLPDLPDWYVKTVLLYLLDVKPDEASDLLVRFSLVTHNKDWRSAALEILDNLQDSNLTEKIRQEEIRLKKADLTLPEFLSSRMVKD